MCVVKTFSMMTSRRDNRNSTKDPGNWKKKKRGSRKKNAKFWPPPPPHPDLPPGPPSTRISDPTPPRPPCSNQERPQPRPVFLVLSIFCFSCTFFYFSHFFELAQKLDRAKVESRAGKVAAVRSRPRPNRPCSTLAHTTSAHFHLACALDPPALGDPTLQHPLLPTSKIARGFVFGQRAMGLISWILCAGFNDRQRDLRGWCG